MKLSDSRVNSISFEDRNIFFKETSHDPNFIFALIATCPNATEMSIIGEFDVSNTLNSSIFEGLAFPPLEKLDF
jgi:hypothetical protein